MIKKFVTITYLDDTKDVFECIDYPRYDPQFYTLYVTHEYTVGIPTGCINRIEIKEVWRKKYEPKSIPTPRAIIGFGTKPTTPLLVNGNGKNKGGNRMGQTKSNAKAPGHHAKGAEAKLDS